MQYTLKEMVYKKEKVVNKNVKTAIVLKQNTEICMCLYHKFEVS